MPRRATRPPPLLAEFDDEEREAVLSANRAFYRAFSERDAEAMDQIWAPTGAVVCLHPGQAPLHARAEIMASWRAILRHPERATGGRIAHYRPSFRAGAADRGRTEDDGTGIGTDARSTQTSLARWGRATPVARHVFPTAGLS